MSMMFICRPYKGLECLWFPSVTDNGVLVPDTYDVLTNGVLYKVVSVLLLMVMRHKHETNVLSHA